ncbi:hypothetical protein, partial [uncultured Abyssibacter sp.]|uniref:hypothetical protein n=1 Tax=uncultured Abyssibacter sp. TaxID=2320202 RepID=UPI0032B2ECD6
STRRFDIFIARSSADRCRETLRQGPSPAIDAVPRRGIDGGDRPTDVDRQALAINTFPRAQPARACK